MNGAPPTSRPVRRLSAGKGAGGPAVKVTAVLLFLASTSFAHTVVRATPRGVLVAQPRTLQLFDRDGRHVLWSGASVQTPTAIAASNNQAAVIDALDNEVTLIDFETKRATTITTGETPVDGTFINGALYLLERDARALERIGMDGARASVDVAADPVFLRQVNGVLYVYSRVPGVLQKITPAPFALKRSAHVGAFASDLELDAMYAYLVFPRTAKIGVVRLATLTPYTSIDAGAVPVDLAFTSSATALTAKTMAVADVSSKRVWIIEGMQSPTEAIARGFLRGLLGLGLFGAGNSEFPTGVDRVIVSGSRWYAYDTSSETLYRFTKKKSTVVAKNIAPSAFSVAPGGVFVWDEAVRRLQRLDGE